MLGQIQKNIPLNIQLEYLRVSLNSKFLKLKLNDHVHQT
jgi:hypothetical protein